MKKDLNLYCPSCREIINESDVIIKQIYSGCRTTLINDPEPPEYENRCPYCDIELEEIEKILNDRED